jgi:hypothetical protein
MQTYVLGLTLDSSSVWCSSAWYLAAEYRLLLSHGLQQVLEVQFHKLSVLGPTENPHKSCIQKANPLHDRRIGVQHVSTIHLGAPCVCDLFLQLQWSKRNGVNRSIPQGDQKLCLY